MEWILEILKVIVIPLIVLMWVSLNRKVDRSMDKEICKHKHDTLKGRLDRDDVKFDNINRKLDDIKDTLVRLDTTIQLNRGV
jgi:uncharacterized membrane protein